MATVNTNRACFMTPSVIGSLYDSSYWGSIIHNMSSSTTASYDRPRVGGDILCLCTRCKMELAHVVMAMGDGRPKRVVCKTCKSEHSFRVNGHRSESARSTRPYRPVQKTSMLASQMWEKLLNE